MAQPAPTRTQNGHTFTVTEVLNDASLSRTNKWTLIVKRDGQTIRLYTLLIKRDRYSVVGLGTAQDWDGAYTLALNAALEAAA